MSRESFLVLCTKLNDYIVKSSTRFRKAVSVEEQVALMLYYLSDEGDDDMSAGQRDVTEVQCSRTGG